jgi:hypothetical protein
MCSIASLSSGGRLHLEGWIINYVPHQSQSDLVKWVAPLTNWTLITYSQCSPHHQMPTNLNTVACKIENDVLQKLKLLRKAKTTWHDAPSHHGTKEIPPPPPEKPCLDKMRNTLARTVAQIRGHWRSAVYPKRIRKMADDRCWFCQGPAKMTRSHVLLH